MRTSEILEQRLEAQEQVLSAAIKTLRALSRRGGETVQADSGDVDTTSLIVSNHSAEVLA